MEVFNFLLEFIGSASGPLAYSLVFGVLLACGLGLPLPEDVALITGGYLVHKGQADLGVMLVMGFAGIIAGDTMVFLLGRAGRKARGRARPKGLLARHLTAERIAKVEAQFERRGPIMIMIARFLPGVRAATYFVAGGAGMSYWRFVLFDGIAALLSAPFFVLLGAHFGQQIHDVIGWAEEFHRWLIAAVFLGLAILALRWLLRRPGLQPLAAKLGLASKQSHEAAAQKDEVPVPRSQPEASAYPKPAGGGAEVILHPSAAPKTQLGQPRSDAAPAAEEDREPGSTHAAG